MITVRDLAYAYDDDPAIRDVSLDIDAGETVAILGANGTGKTTFLKLLADLLEPSGGTIDRDVVVGFAPEDPSTGLFAETVAAEVAFFPRNRGLDAEALSEDAMARMRVESLRDRQPGTLSVGEQRRVSIAAVLAGAPDVIALDEPTAGLDRRGERHLGALLRELEQTLVFCTHATDFAFEVADRAIVFADGRVLADGPSTTVLTDDELLSEAGIRVPELVTWSRERHYAAVPSDFDEAVQWFIEAES